jgi:hypothetical protein
MSYKVKGRKLAHHPGCQCRVREHEDGVIEFISYTTLVIRAVPQKLAKNYFSDYAITIKDGEQIDEDAYFLECTGTYSRTTAKQIGYFLKEYFGDLNYYDMKAIAGQEEVVVSHKKHAMYW